MSAVASEPAEAGPRSATSLRRLTWSLFAYGVPAYFLSRYLMSLTGGGLWTPPEWRNVVFVLGLLGGMAAFHLPRLRLERFKLDAATHPEDASPRAQRKLLDVAARAQRGALTWLAITVAAVLGHTLLRWATVQPWTPGPEVVAALKDVRIAVPLYLEEDGPPHGGSFLFPLGFPTSARGRKLVEELRYAYADGARVSVRSEALDHRLLEVVDVVRDDERAMLGVTQGLFVVAHLAVLLAGSVAYGFGYSWAEEALTHGGELAGKAWGALFG